MTSITSLLFLLLLKLLCTIIPAQGSNNNKNNNAPSIIKTRRRKLQSSVQSGGVTIGGSVYYDINKNGIRDANESGIPNVQVQIRTCTNGRVGNTRTNSGGEFIVELEEPGCYYARLDPTAFTFTEGSDLDSISGKTANVELKEGEAKFWYAGIVPEEGSGITAAPTFPPTVSMAPTVTVLPSMGPTTRPTSGPTTADPTLVPTVSPTTAVPSVAPSVAPSTSPTTTSSPSACIVRDVVDENIMSSSPIMRASFGMVFSLSTPEINETGSDNIFVDDAAPEMEYIQITSISLRVLTPLLNQATSANYQVWYRQGDYKLEDNSTQAFDTRGNFDGWTLVADGNSMGSNPPEDGSESTIQIEETTTNQPDTTSQEPLLMDSNFLSGVFPSDNNDYKAQPSTLLKDGGMDTLDAGGSRIKTYLYQIPTSIFTPVDIPKYGGKVSFYVTLDKAKLQYGDADGDEWDTIDVQNEEYDYENNEDMNVRIHVGEGVTSYPWTDILAFYNPRRFLGKVWYEQIMSVPCDMHESAPSQSPTELALPPLPGSGTASDYGAVGEAVETRFVVSVFLQQDIRDARKMNEEVQEVFRVTMMDFLNEEWVIGHCVWGEALEVEFQKLSLLEGVRHRHLLRRGGGQRQDTFGPLFSKRRQLQTEITILQVEMFIKGVAYDDLRVCPNGAIPATPTTRGDNWDETMAQIGIDFVADNAEKLGEELKEAHVYFEEIFAVTADPDLLERPVDRTTVITTTTTETEDTSFPLIPIIAAICGAVLVLCLLSCLCFRRRRKRQKQEQLTMEDASETPEGIIIVTDTDKGDSDLGNKTKEDGDTASEEGGMEQAAAGGGGGVAEEVEWTVPVESDDPLMVAWPALRKVPPLEEVIMMRGLPRRRSEPNMATVTSSPTVLKRTRSISCIREVWVNLNKSWSNQDSELSGGYVDQLLNGTLYPVDDLDILDWERERHLMGEDPSSPYVPHGGSIEHNFIDESEAIRIESPRAAPVTPSIFSDEIPSDGGQAEEEVIPPTPEPAAPPKINPLVMQQVEMLEAKWKQLKEDYDDDDDSDDEVNLDNFDVNERIDQLMTHIERLELDRKMKLASLKRQEEEDDELARKRMIRGGKGINYEEELNKDFVIRKKRKKRKSKKVEEIDSDEISEESSSDEEGEDGEFDVKWMRLKVPLAAQDAGAMRSLVKKGQDLDDSD
mmetsp:Transcript_24561/g.44096  ORF Transcript_24561/g.44096 Transcript_24561/m.44096 type:complete len:1190 (-) Transcript_24561:157-3726(-)|eukprot:CAMPEP_0201906756 /NCGR_PEP_ID=MMETSP0902-20130614/57184_1 /ASSEMBLY_ACC=CAM_ASM_000551 /TAXON_ID=420261 /ORGANISM="Thalassiosira antarctica, Strain CCMP982" /LENGTH=1189 /DNA_ID=CAMNT_0048440901 /DNA_START=195 /DNA_END=3764 /DNA_ORIENTATION=+